MLRPLLPLAVLAACAGAPTPKTVVPDVDRSTPVARAMPAGTILRIPPCTVQALDASADAVDGMFREAMRQSAWFDVAAGPVAAGPSDWSNGAEVEPALELSIDGAEGTATVTLRTGATTQHLAAARIDRAQAIPEALDGLALRCRLALGDPVEEPPLPIALAYSADLEAVADCEAGLALLQDGRFAAAARRLEGVRRRDGGSAFALEITASVAAMLGDPQKARSLAQEALALDRRRSPTTTHRLGRTMLLARASTEPALARQYDDELRRFAQVAATERPYDPEVRLTQGIAANFLGRFAEARTILDPLALRLPDHSGVLYHLGWAALGAGDPPAAIAAFARAARSLPVRSTAVPRALALYAAGDQDRVRAFLAELTADAQIREGFALHEVRRMQAAHELLCGNTERAAECMLEDLSWLLAHPSLLELRTGELADTSETLVRLGYGERLRPILSSIVELWPQTPMADAAAYAGAMAAVARGHQREPVAESGLMQRGKSFWSLSLAAFGYRQEGELVAEQQALGLAAKHSTSPLLTAALITNLRSQGRGDEADTLRDALHRELLTLDLRRRSNHPLLGPELAYAFLTR